MQTHGCWQLFSSVHLLGWTRCPGKLQTWKDSRHWVALQKRIRTPDSCSVCRVRIAKKIWTCQGILVDLLLEDDIHRGWGRWAPQKGAGLYRYNVLPKRKCFTKWATFSFVIHVKIFYWCHCFCRPEVQRIIKSHKAAARTEDTKAGQGKAQKNGAFPLNGRWWWSCSAFWCHSSFLCSLLVQPFLLVTLKAVNPVDQRKDIHLGLKHSWSFPSPLKINYHSRLLIWAFDKNPDHASVNKHLCTSWDIKRTLHFVYDPINSFSPWQWFPTYSGYYIQFGNMWKYSSCLHSLTLILFVDSPRFPLPRI